MITYILVSNTDDVTRILRPLEAELAFCIARRLRFFTDNITVFKKPDFISRSRLVRTSVDDSAAHCRCMQCRHQQQNHTTAQEPLVGLIEHDSNRGMI